MLTAPLLPPSPMCLYSALQGKLRIGLAEQTVLVSLAQAVLDLSEALAEAQGEGEGEGSSPAALCD
ncbi:hypothetical protein EON64_03920, partial [archaeon]